MPTYKAGKNMREPKLAKIGEKRKRGTIYALCIPPPLYDARPASTGNQSLTDVSRNRRRLKCMKHSGKKEKGNHSKREKM